VAILLMAIGGYVSSNCFEDISKTKWKKIILLLANQTWHVVSIYIQPHPCFCKRYKWKGLPITLRLWKWRINVHYMPPTGWMLLLQMVHMNSPFCACTNDFAPNLHLNNLRIYLKSIAIEEKGVGPQSSHKKCKFLVHPCQMKFDHKSTVLECNSTTCNYPWSHQQWDSNSGTQWVLNFVSRSLYDLII
jgi:hypothetical protein